MWLQTLVVFAVVACSAVFVARNVLRKIAGKSDGCSGCSGCAQNSPKACAQPVVFYPTKRSNL